MPFLAALVLYMNSKRSWVGGLKNGWVTNALLVVCFLLFLGLTAGEGGHALKNGTAQRAKGRKQPNQRLRFQKMEQSLIFKIHNQLFIKPNYF